MADGIVALNSYGPLLDFDIDNNGAPRSVLGISGAKGGMSGAPLFHIALTDVAEITRQVGIPVIACGGVSQPEQVIKMMMAGAHAVQIYTAAHVRGQNAPSIFTEVNQGLIDYMDQKGIGKISDVQGRALPLLDQETTLEVIVPEVDKDNCVGCNKCIPICLKGAITEKREDNINKKGSIVEINPQACIGCGHCVQICPTIPKSLSMQ